MVATNSIKNAGQRHVSDLCLRAATTAKRGQGSGDRPWQGCLKDGGCPLACRTTAYGLARMQFKFEHIRVPRVYGPI